jgi:hypothetical protein
MTSSLDTFTHSQHSDEMADCSHVVLAETVALTSLENRLTWDIDLQEVVLSSMKKGIFAVLFLNELTRRLFKFLRPTLIRFFHWYTQFAKNTGKVAKGIANDLHYAHKADTGYRVAVCIGKDGAYKDVKGHRTTRRPK